MIQSRTLIPFRAISCDTPLLLNGKVIAGGQSTHGTTVIFRCNEGFILEGKTNSTCVHEDPNSAKGKWSEPTPACKVTKVAVYGSTVTYHCNQGFVLDGKRSSKCSQNGTDNVYGKWNDQSPVCKAINCETPILLNGQVTASELSTHGTTVNFRCYEGFILEGKTNSTCVHEDPNSAKGKWSEPTPVCKEITCDQPVLQHGKASTGSLQYNSTVSYSCEDNYSLTGKATSTCVQEDKTSIKGVWADPIPICTEIGLESPSSTLNYVHGDVGGRTNTRDESVSAMNIGIGIGCATVVLVLVIIGIILAIKNKSRESPPHETLEEEPPAKSKEKVFQNPLYNIEEWNEGQNETRGSSDMRLSA
ncbi:complement receptor type 2-like [Lineus longissimus]|uniref:complement receptor type 2-like n=1 Tax=Lineus longissimus TaxID=88925 RepID=UPI00315C9786